MGYYGTVCVSGGGGGGATRSSGYEIMFPLKNSKLNISPY